MQAGRGGANVVRSSRGSLSHAVHGTGVLYSVRCWPVVLVVLLVQASVRTTDAYAAAYTQFTRTDAYPLSGLCARVSGRFPEVRVISGPDSRRWYISGGADELHIDACPLSVCLQSIAEVV